MTENFYILISFIFRNTIAEVLKLKNINILDGESVAVTNSQIHTTHLNQVNV